MSESVKCRSCARLTTFELGDLNREIAAGLIEDRGRTPGSYMQGDRLLFWRCPECRKTEATAVLGVGLQMRRVQAGIARLRAAGKPTPEAVALAVESQMDEDERRRFPDFYHWRRECPAETAPYQWTPPATFGQPQDRV